MKLWCSMLAGLLLFLCQLGYPEEVFPVASGYVTYVGPSGTFDLQGSHVRLTPQTVIWRGSKKQAEALKSLGDLYLGQTMDIYGRLQKKTNSIRADRIVLIDTPPASINGTALIEAIPGTFAPEAHIIRADGYLLRFTPATSVTWTPPLKSMADLGPNIWIVYEGIQAADGHVDLKKAVLSGNEISRREDGMRRKREYDPAAVDDSASQGALSRHFLGLDPKKLPPHKDPVLQERIDRIGGGLIPAYQRGLAPSDPTRINFRFQVIDSERLRHPLTLANGIILLPYQGVQRMENDSQLASLLAVSIAEVLQKDQLRYCQVATPLGVANMAGLAAGFFVPGLGLATALTTDRVAAHVLDLQQQQSGRVSLFLLHDAGYDIGQAPIAWWLLEPKKPQPIEKIKLPSRSAHLYMALGTTWHPMQHPSQP